MLCKGQVVLYGANGVCTVDDVTEKRVGKTKMEYYVLHPVCNQTATLFVPIANRALVSKIRGIVTKEEAAHILNELPECFDWIESKPERTETFREIISSGDCMALVALVRTIRAHEQRQLAEGKRLHLSDERFLKEAQKMVCEEFSLALDIDHDEVISRIVQ